MSLIHPEMAPKYPQTAAHSPNAQQQIDRHLNNLPLAVIEWDANLRVTRWSFEAEKIFGWKAEEVLHQPIHRDFNFIFLEDEQAVTDAISALLSGKVRQSISRNRNHRKDGSIIFCEWYNSALWDEANQLVSILTLVQDVTDRKLAEAELQRQVLRSRLFADITLKIRQSLQLHEILETTVVEVQKLLKADRVLVYHLAPDGTGTVLNESVGPGLPRLVGEQFSPEVFPNECHSLYLKGRVCSIDNIQTANLTPCHREFLQNLNVQAKLVVPLLQGTKLWGLVIAHQCSTTRNWSGFEIELLQQLANQVSIALSQAHLWQALQLSEERFRQLTENIQQVFWMRDLEKHQVVYVSPAYEQVWGRSGESLYQDPAAWIAAIHPEDRDRILAISDSIHPNTYDVEFRILRPDGEIRWIRNRAFPVKNEEGATHRIAVIAEDITRRKRLDEELLKTLTKEKELSELKSRFVCMTSHEFRTPLSTILSASELLEYYGHRWTEEERLEQLHLIQATVHHMTQLLEDILLIGKTEANRLDFNPETLNLTDFCHSLLTQIKRGAANQHVVSFINPHPPIEGWVDDKLLRQILTNLLSNAAKYSPKGSTIELELDYHPGEAVFRVKDQGIGIPEEDQARLFETFHRAKNVGTTPGTGLGLTIVRCCVAAHQGKIMFSSQVGVGTTFEVRIPLGEKRG